MVLAVSVSLGAVWLSSILGLTLIVWFIYWKNTRDKQLIDKIPGFKDWPLFGDILHIEKDPADYIVQLMGIIDKYRTKNITVLKLKIMEVPWIMLFSADEVEKLLTSNINIDKAAEYDNTHNWLGLGLLNSSGNKWKSRRRMLTPSFHFSILKDFIVLINKHARDLKDKLLCDACDTDKPYNIYEDITLCTLDIICDTAMGVNLDALHDGDSEYVQSMYVIKDGLDHRSRTPFCQYDMVFNATPNGRKVNKAIALTHNFTLQVIKDRREAKESDDSEGGAKTGKQKPFLDMLLDCRDEDGNPLTDSEIREEVDTFMFEGHDTTSTGIGFTIYLLGENIEAQRRCQEEIDGILEDSSKELTTADLSKMTYLECCIKEAMRIFPPVPFFGRALSEETEIGGYQVPKGVSIYVSSMSLHRDPKIFPDPEKYDPNRFTPENCLNRNPFAYAPFSAGPRNCIGRKFAMMELKIIIATLLKNFNIESTQSRAELRVTPSLVLQPSNGIKVKLTSRI